MSLCNRVLAVPFGGQGQRTVVDALGRGIHLRATEGNPNEGATIMENTKVLKAISLRVENTGTTTGTFVLFDTLEIATKVYGNVTSAGVNVTLSNVIGTSPAAHTAQITALYNGILRTSYKAYGVRVNAYSMQGNYAQAQLQNSLQLVWYNLDSTVSQTETVNQVFELPDDRCDGLRTIMLQKELMLTDRFAVIGNILPGVMLDVIFQTEAAVNEF